MPEAVFPAISRETQKLDRQLLLSLALSPLAASISTIVGFTVAHWIAISAYKRTGYLVSTCCFVFCAIAGALAWSARAQVVQPDETLPLQGRQLFMAKLALLLAALCAVVVLAGTLVLVTLRPSD